MNIGLEVNSGSEEKMKSLSDPKCAMCSHGEPDRVVKIKWHNDTIEFIVCVKCFRHAMQQYSVCAFRPYYKPENTCVL